MTTPVHIGFHNLGDLVLRIVVHGEGEVVPTVSPGGKTPGGGVGGEVVGTLAFFHSLFVFFSAPMAQIGAVDAEYLFIVPVLIQEGLAEGEEVIMGHGVLKEDDALFFLGEEPSQGFIDHLGSSQVLLFKECVHLAWPFGLDDATCAVGEFAVLPVTGFPTVARNVKLGGLYRPQHLENVVSFLYAIVEDNQYRNIEHDRLSLMLIRE